MPKSRLCPPASDGGADTDRITGARHSIANNIFAETRSVRYRPHCSGHNGKSKLRSHTGLAARRERNASWAQLHGSSREHSTYPRSPGNAVKVTTCTGMCFRGEATSLLGLHRPPMSPLQHSHPLAQSDHLQRDVRRLPVAVSCQDRHAVPEANDIWFSFSKPSQKVVQPLVDAVDVEGCDLYRLRP